MVDDYVYLEGMDTGMGNNMNCSDCGFVWNSEDCKADCGMRAAMGMHSFLSKEDGMKMEIERVAHELAMDDLRAWLANKSSAEAHFVRFDASNERDVDSQVDDRDPESLLISMEEVVDRAEFDAQVVEEKKEDLVSDQIRQQRFNMYKERHIRRLHWEVKDLKAQSEKGTDMVRFVTIRFCDFVIELEDGTEAREYIGKEGKSLEADKFTELMEAGRIKGYHGNGQVFGMSDLREMEMEYEDFSNGDVYIDHGNGVCERITEDQFLETMTGRMGNREIVDFKMRSEIRYGKAMDWHMPDYEPDFQEVLSRIEAEGHDDGYEFRDRSEKRYWFNLYRDRIMATRTYAELVQTCSGVLFPIDNKQLPENHPLRKRWLRPMNVMSKEDRQELLGLYHEMKEGFMEKRADAEGKLDQVIEMLNDPRIGNMDQALRGLLTAEQAASVLSVASSRSRASGTQVFSKQDWWKIKRIAEQVVQKPVDIKESVHKALEKLSGIKIMDANLKAEAIKKQVNSDEAKDLLDYGSQMLRVNNKKVFDYKTYQTLVDISKTK